MSYFWSPFLIELLVPRLHAGAYDGASGNKFLYLASPLEESVREDDKLRC